MFNTLFNEDVSALDARNLIGLIGSPPSVEKIFFGNPLHQATISGECPAAVTRLESAPLQTQCIKENCQAKFLGIGSSSLAICDPQRDVVIRSLHEHDGPLKDIAWHRSQPFLLSTVGDDSTLRMWDVRSHPAQVSMRRVQRPFNCLEYSPDSNFVAAGGESCIVLYDLCSSQNAVQINCVTPVTFVQVHSLRFNPAECLLVTSHTDNTCRFWDIDTGECVTQAINPPGQIQRIEYQPEGKYLIVATNCAVQTIKWEPYILLSQHQYGASATGVIDVDDGMTNANNTNISILDMVIRNGRLLQLAAIIGESGAGKSAGLGNPTVRLFSTSLNRLEKPFLAEGTASGCSDMPITMFGKMKIEQQQIQQTPIANSSHSSPKKSVSVRRVSDLPPPASGVPATNHRIRRRSSTDAIESASCSSGSASTSTTMSRSSSSSRTGRANAKIAAAVVKSKATKDQKAGIAAQTVASKCDEIVKGGIRARESQKKRKVELTALLQRNSIRGDGAEAMVDEGAKTEESHVLACLIREYLLCQKAHSTSLNSDFLEHLRPLFNHPNNSYVQLAIDFLGIVVHSFGDSIRHGLLSKQHYIGVDVAAESRYERCMKCRNELMQIRLNSSFFIERMDETQVRIFEGILRRIDEIVDT